MAQIAECSECGNTRALFGECPHCGSSLDPLLAVDVVELNIKHGNPSADDALDILAIKIRNLQDLGVKAILLIHGYGSSGEGGRIKRAIQRRLRPIAMQIESTSIFMGKTYRMAVPHIMA